MEDDPRPMELVTGVPSFSRPRSQVLDPPLPETEGEDNDPTQIPTPTAEPSRFPFGLGSRKPATVVSATPTGTSSPESGANKEDVKLTGELVAAAIGLAFLGAAALVRMRRNRKLRQPSKKQLGEMGAPLGRIAARHIPVEWLNKDMIDGLEFGSAIAAWANEGPLTVIDRPDPGLPSDLNQEIPQ